MTKKRSGNLGRLFLCWGMFIVLLFSSVLPVLAATDSTGLTEGSDAEVSKTVLNDTGPKLVLVENGAAKSTIILASDATEPERKSAQELQDYIKQISGAELPVVDETTASGVIGTKIFIGRMAPNPDMDKILAGGNEPDSFRLHVAEGAIQLVGIDSAIGTGSEGLPGSNGKGLNSAKGTLYAAYELLEQIGVRWFMPGDIGTVVPSMKTIEVSYQDTIQHPGFKLRGMQAVESYANYPFLPPGVNITEAVPWVEHMRLNQRFLGTHGLVKMPNNIPNRTKNPELFLKDANGNATIQLDVTKPEVLDLVVKDLIERLKADPNLKYPGIGPDDGPALVLEPNPEWDVEGKIDATMGMLSTTDRYVKFYNLVLDELDKAGYTDVKIAFFAYSNYLNPPVRFKPNPRLVPVIPPITFDRIHTIGNPLSWERNYLKDIIEGWKAVGCEEIEFYSYLFNLADPGLPFSIADMTANEFKYFKDQGITGIRAECMPSWGYHGLGLYLGAKMMWNPDLDVEALREDFFTKFYGPAAAPMKEHFEILENAFENADYFTGATYDFPHILPDNVMQEMERTLKAAEDAAQTASDQVYAKRVHMLRVAYDYGDSFLGMMANIKNLDFLGAKGNFDRIYELREEAVLHSPVIISTAASYDYADRFFANIVKQGKQRLSNGNRIVAQLPDEWDAMLFPDASGAEKELWKPGLSTEDWMKLKTYSETWSSQGLRYYNGHVWYRTTVDVDSKFNTGNKIRLWFSSIDETARVWMNGQELELTTRGNALTRPWEFDATPAIKFGEPNLIVVDAGNEQVLDELGTGGIVGSAMFWEVVTEIDNIPPTAPGYVRDFEQLSDSELRLSWPASTDNVGIAEYQLYQNADGGAYKLIGKYDSNTTTCTVTELKSGPVYRWIVKAVDFEGNVASSGVTGLRLRPWPIINTQPQDQTVEAGQEAVFKVGVTLTEAHSYQWKKNGVNIPGATSAELRIINVKASDAGRYSVVVTTNLNNLKVTSSEAVLTVPNATTYTVTYDANGGSGNMSASTVTSGAAVELPANGFTPPEGMKFKEWAIGSIDGEKVGAGSTYTFTQDTQVYAIWSDNAVTCIVTYNTNGGVGTMAESTVTSGTAIELPANGFTPPPGKKFKEWAIGSAAEGSIRIGAGSTYAFTANTEVYAIWGPLKPSAPDRDLPNNKVFELISGSELRFSWGPSIDNAGIAEYKVLQSVGGAAAQYIEIASYNSDTTTCTVTGLETGKEYRYIVRAVDFDGAWTNSIITGLIMKPWPITTQPQSQAVSNGGEAVFTVTVNAVAVGTDSLTYQWKKNGADIPGATSAELRIQGVQASDAGSYSIVITMLNKINNTRIKVTSSEAVLTVN